MAIPCVVIQWDASRTAFTVVNYNYNPLSLPVQGLDPDLEVLVKRTPYAIPEYDPRLKLLVTENTISQDNDTEYPSCRKWLTNYSLISRSAAEMAISIDESENDANYMVFPQRKQLKYIVLALAIIDRKASGLTITAKQQAILDKLQDKAQRLWTNHLNCEAKKAAISAAEEVDLDEGWENEDPEQ